LSWVLTGSGGVASSNIVLLIVLTAGAGCVVDFEHRAALDSLVREKAAEAELVRRLNLHFEVYERGTPNWESLQSFLARESPSTLRPLREAVQKYPRILYHTTMWQMTWVFIDEKGVVRDYYLTSQ
jgi:hypothetical protein